jgi:hypothetical protein
MLTIDRFREVAELLGMLSGAPVVLVRAPPQTVKTSLAQLLRVHVSKLNWNCTIIAGTNWARKEAPIVKHLKLDVTQHLLIIDEAQISYPLDGVGSPFWENIKMLQSCLPKDTGHRVVLFSSYYAHVIGNIHTPVEFDTTHSMGMERIEHDRARPRFGSQFQLRSRSHCVRHSKERCRPPNP